MQRLVSISSMTGFGRSLEILEQESVQIECEIKSVNSRYLESSIKIPRIFSEFEPVIKRLLANTFSRGKIDLNLSYRKINNKLDNTYDIEQLKNNLEDYGKLLSDLGITWQDSDKISFVNKCLHESSAELPVDSSKWLTLKPVIDSAIRSLQESRIGEGKVIAEEMLSRVAQLNTISKKVILSLEGVSETLKDKLQARLTKIIGPDAKLDEARVLQEVAILVDRADVSEELSRLKAHLVLFQETIQNGGVLGKKLDFLCQEIFREINTLGSKAGIAEVQALVVDAKVELEKIREQVQNLE
jgi:uncharacterized protein (TIGR00255 family)